MTNSSVEENTAHEPMPPNHIMAQKNGTSRKYMLCQIWRTSPKSRTMGVRRMRERRDV